MLWYQHDPKRLLLEQQTMKQKFPQFRLVQLGTTLCWAGELVTNRNNRYEILVEYPDNFPYAAPTVKPIEPEVVAVDRDGKSKHQYPNGKLCLFYPGDRTFSINTTAATVVAVAAAWFFAYETWLESGKTDWPGQELNHDDMLAPR